MFEKRKIEELLKLLNDILEEENIKISIVVCGGSALIINKSISRNTTMDIDILAFAEEDNEKIILKKAKPLPKFLKDIVSEISENMKLPENWLNSEIGDIFDWGLPDGIEKRLNKKIYGKNLIVYFINRLDQIYLKLYASVDKGPGKHLNDLLELKPNEEEILKASLWSMQQDPSDDFKQILKDMLIKIGYKNVAKKI